MLTSLLVCLGGPATLPAIAQQPQPVAPHPLLPEFHGREIHNRDWPQAFHDPLATGFSPLTGHMNDVPVEILSIELGGQADSVTVLQQDDGPPRLLVQDQQLRCLNLDGNLLWSGPAQRILFAGRLVAGGPWDLVALSGSTVAQLDAETGQVLWSQTFNGTLQEGKVRIGRVLQDTVGLQLAVFPQYAHEGYLFGWSNKARTPELLWSTDEAKVADWQPQADHGVTTLLDGEQRIVWNIRHHTINAFEARTGRLLHRTEFESGGKWRRNYGPSAIGVASDGQPVLIVASHSVEHHLNAFAIRATDAPQMRFDQSQGYVFDPDRLGSKMLFDETGFVDVDGDGGLDVVYARRSAESPPVGQTVIVDAWTGRETSIDGTWLVAVADLEQDDRPEIFVYADPRAEMPTQGTLQIYQCDAQGIVHRLYSRPGTELVMRPLAPSEQPAHVARSQMTPRGPVRLSVGGNPAVLVRDTATGQWLALCKQDSMFTTKPVDELPRDARPLTSLIESVPKTAEASGVWVYQTARGDLELRGRDGRPRAALPVQGGDTPRVTAADLDGDARAELVIHTDERLHLYRIGTERAAQRVASFPLPAVNPSLSPPVRDLTGDGRKNLVTTTRGADNELVVQLRAVTGSVLWQTALPMPASGQLSGWVTGYFLAPDRAGIFLWAKQDEARQEAYLLDGRTGNCVWQGNAAQMPDGQWRTCHPAGIPTVHDADQDGVEDLMLDYLDFFAILRGRDGHFIQPPRSTPVVPGRWKLAYNTFIPFGPTPDAARRFLVPSGYGGIGVLDVDYETERWMDRLGYDTPVRAGLIDVDGDGRTEVGYEQRVSGRFVCRDLLSGQEEWSVPLAGRGYGPCVSADINGDGKGEFLLGNVCLGTDSAGRGRLLWSLPVAASETPIIANVWGDAAAELIVPRYGGRIVIYTSAE